jgi:hypothetical protein
MDQYYTSNDIIATVVPHIVDAYETLSKPHIVDFSAGDGRLGDALLSAGISSQHLIEYDIDPKDKHDRIVKQDWLSLATLPPPVGDFILVFNPPFGKACHTACQFIHHALTMPNTRVVAAVLILPLYPLVFHNASLHQIDLIPSGAYTYKDNPVSAPSCLHKVRLDLSKAAHSNSLSFSLYTSLKSKPYYKPVSELSSFTAHDTRGTQFSEMAHMLPIGLIRKTGHYAGLTAILIEQTACSLFTYDETKDTLLIDVKPFDVDMPVNKRPWMQNEGRWRLTSFSDDENFGGEKTGCASLKITRNPQSLMSTSDEHKPQLRQMLTDFVTYVGRNKDAVRGGGKGPKSIGVGTFYWISCFAN